MGQASIVMQEKVEQEIIDMSQMCTIIGLSVSGHSDELYNECKKIVISQQNGDVKMTKREEVHKLYKDFIELFNEQEHKFKSYKADYSNE